MMASRFRKNKEAEEEEGEKEKTSKEKEVEEEKGIEIVVDKVRAQIFAAILFYLYTDHLQCAPHIIEEIGRVAKQYRLPRLQGKPLHIPFSLSLPSINLGSFRLVSKAYVD